MINTFTHPSHVGVPSYSSMCPSPALHSDIPFPKHLQEALEVCELSMNGHLVLLQLEQLLVK